MSHARKPIGRGQRTRIFERDGFRCKRCGRGPSSTPPASLTVDHIIPVARGGQNVDWNLQTLCSDCNGGKAAREPSAHDVAIPADPRIRVMIEQQAQVPQKPAAHPLVGKFCHKSVTGELARFGWNWQFQARVDSVVGDVALVEFYSAIDGESTEIKPVPLSEMLDGSWIFARNEADWRERGNESMQRYWNGVHVERDQQRLNKPKLI